ncbi:hypothetical protein PK35_03060 [Tamlana nanhaiensis]|uniref:DUF4861 domain-containing protein n=1 Tax=Neotamlana nanhaiensis TaxID=1382798 RepID=A0A0D7W7V0_9FLAO|nr:DUF4861 domain-containing protein [Tamlana nanhaiensis]KJD34743.1 hypothetical protein PK35_03060 [Tamlana nanhaiensis]
MRKLVALSALLVAGVACKSPEKKGESIVLSNTSNIKLTDKAIAIHRDSLTVYETLNNYPLLMSGNDTIPVQINDTTGDGIWDELFFVTNFEPNQEKSIDLQWVDAEPEYTVRTSARFGKRSAIDSPVEPATDEVLIAKDLPKSLGYQRYQTDGPSWENDKVGFRHYLDGRNSKDLFGKKIAEISPEDVGINAKGEVEDNYHVMEDWGRDILAVGNSVGLGGYALITDDALFRLGVTVNDSVNNVEKTTFKIQNEGPVKSLLTYNYKNWNATDDRTYNVAEETTIWPGMYAYKNTVTLKDLKGDEKLAVGLVDINNDNPLSVYDENEKFITLYTHDKQTYNKEWWLGMALILPKDAYIDNVEAPESGQLTQTILARLNIENDVPISYYAVACWELKDPKFKNEAYFANYVKDLTNQLSAEIDVKIVK